MWITFMMPYDQFESFAWIDLQLRDKNVSGVIINLNLCFEDEKKIWNDIKLSNW